MWVKAGDAVQPFDGANQAIGTLVLRFASSEEQEEAMANDGAWCNLTVEESERMVNNNISMCLAALKEERRAA